nr:prepilin-type N-terminal cleavage/methylation domain-containing protein [Tumebacillus amylolyticus]
MIRKLFKKLKEEKGVTLIELLAVIVILGIIAAIGIPAIIDSRKDAETSTGAANAQTMTEVAKRLILKGEAYTDAKATASEDTEFDFNEVLTAAGITPATGTVDNTAHTYTADGGTYTIVPDTGVVTYDHDQ